ncbi:MAG TPA: FtsX-like permease family protein, partial [Bryobacteraceae bacterium]|nr:FtsX-like permease family protein [Bryobacteraceae bacterium]
RNLLGARNTRWLAVMGRLRDGVSVEAAETAARHLHHALLREEGEAAKTIENVKLVLEPGGRGLAILRGSIARPVKILLGITLLVLLIGCANIANLLLARGAARQTESSVRLALGSGRFRLLRQFLFESSLLALAGCLAGLLLAPLMVQGIIALGEQTRPAAIDARIDSMVLLFTFGLGVVSALVFGTLPAIRFSNANLHGITQGSSRSVTASRSGQRLSRGLIAGQVSLALLLLIGSGLLVRSLLRITRQDFGFDRTNMITVRIEAGNAGYREPEQFTKLGRTLEARLGSLPGVDSVSFALCGTMGVSGCSRRSDVAVEGYVSQAGEDMGVGVNHVSPNYLDTFKMRLSSGRSFNRGDHGSAPKVALVNDALVRRYFPGADPIGRRLWFDTETRKEPIQIVGVVGDHKRNQPREIVEPAVMLSFDQFPERFRHIELRTSVPPGQLLAPVGQAISDLDSRLQVIGPHTMEQALSRLISTELLMARLCTLFGFLAMALACLGVYGVLSHSVVRRTSEIGIRMAMGARRGDVLALIWREAASLVVIGSCLGLGVAIAAGRLLEAFLFGITSRDPVSFAVPTLILFAVTMLAAYLPARRASALNPIRALRYE